MDERTALCHYSVVNSDRQTVTFRLAPSSSGSAGQLQSSCSSVVALAAASSSPPFSSSLQCHRDHWVFKMICSRFCILLLILKVFLLGVILPVHLQHVDYQSEQEHIMDPDEALLHGYPNPSDTTGGDGGGSSGDQLSGQGNQEDGVGNDDGTNEDGTDNVTDAAEPGDAESESQVAPPPPEETYVTESAIISEAGSEAEAAPSASDDGNDGDDIVVASPADETANDEAPAAEEAPAESGDEADGAGSDDGDSDNNNADDADNNEETSAVSATVVAEAPSCPALPESSVTLDQLLEKIESLSSTVKNIDDSIDKMETLMASTVVDERIYKCIAAITTGNQTLAVKYWNQILRYQDTATKRTTVLTQLIKESYSGKEDNIFPVVKFIDGTQQYYGYSILYKEMTNYGHIYNNRAVFTLASYIKKSCGSGCELFKTLPQAVQSIYSDYFTLQNKFNKGYLYYAKRCVARHYYYCLDVLTKRIEGQELDGLESEERRRYQWKLNATDDTVSKFFILNQDKYWSYRLQDLNNSPRFKMEEAGSIFEIEWAHFQFKLHSDDEIMIQVRDTNIFLEGEEVKFDNTTEVLLHSFYKTDQQAESDRIYWLVKPVQGVDSSSSSKPDADRGATVVHENCKVLENGSDRR